MDSEECIAGKLRRQPHHQRPLWRSGPGSLQHGWTRPACSGIGHAQVPAPVRPTTWIEDGRVEALRAPQLSAALPGHPPKLSQSLPSPGPAPWPPCAACSRACTSCSKAFIRALFNSESALVCAFGSSATSARGSSGKTFPVLQHPQLSRGR